MRHQARRRGRRVTPAPNPEGRLLIPGHSRGRGFPVQEALPAIHRAALSRLERNGGFSPALGTRGHGFRFGESTAAGAGPFLFTGFTALRLVLEVLVVE